MKINPKTYPMKSSPKTFPKSMVFSLFKNMKTIDITIKRKNTKTPPPTMKADFSLLIIALTIK
ncbi:hypothetical protein D3C87_2184880 [compost metagenome]